MSRRIRPSARKKTWHNVMCSSLSETDKKCIEEVFEKFEHLKAEKEALIAGQETLQKTLAEKNAEFEKQSQNFKVLVSDHRTLQQSFDNLKGLYEAEKTKVEKAKEKSIHFAKELQTAKEEIERLSDRNHKCIYLSDDETTEYCVDGPCPKFKTEAQIRTEAIKEFAERLKTEAKLRNHINYGASKQAVSYNEGVIETRKFMLVCIDNLVKEMMGDTK